MRPIRPRNRKDEKGPIVKNFRLDAQTRKIRRRYVRVTKIGKWNTYLQIGCQGFAVVEDTTKRRADWFGDMLAEALRRLIEESCGQKS